THLDVLHDPRHAAQIEVSHEDVVDHDQHHEDHAEDGDERERPREQVDARRCNSGDLDHDMSPICCGMNSVIAGNMNISATTNTSIWTYQSTPRKAVFSGMSFRIPDTTKALRPSGGVR